MSDAEPPFGADLCPAPPPNLTTPHVSPSVQCALDAAAGTPPPTWNLAQSELSSSSTAEPTAKAAVAELPPEPWTTAAQGDEEFPPPLPLEATPHRGAAQQPGLAFAMPSPAVATEAGEDPIHAAEKANGMTDIG